MHADMPGCVCAVKRVIHTGADEQSSEELSDLAMLATSVAARPSMLSDDDAASESLYAASNMQRSTRLQSMFAEFNGRPNCVQAFGPSPLGSPFIQVSTCPRSPMCCTRGCSQHDSLHLPYKSPGTAFM